MQKITLYQQQVEEQGETLKEVTRYTSNMVDAIVQDF